MADQRPFVGVNADFVPAAPAVAVPTAVRARTTEIPVAHFRLNAGYVDLLLNQGAIPWILPPVEPTQNNTFAEIQEYLERLDGIVLTGGRDLDPRWFGLSGHPSVTPIPRRRADHDRRLFETAQQRRLPVLGIGLGMQQINVALGGTLHPHLPESMPRAMPHRDETGEPHRHLVLIEPGTFLYDVYGDGELRVNSDHHQAIDELGEGLRIGARAPDGVIEAIEVDDPDWFCVGVQWHPETETASALDLQLIDCFLEACARQAQPVSLAA